MFKGQKIGLVLMMMVMPLFTVTAANVKAVEDSSLYPILAEGMEVCPDTNYKLVETGNTNDRAVYVLDGNNQLLKVENTNKEETILSFSNGADAFRLLTIPYNEDSDLDYTNVLETNVTVARSGCDPVAKDDQTNYSVKRLKAGLEIGNNQIVFQKSSEDLSKYSLDYREYNSKISKGYKFKDGENITLNDGEILQVTETYRLNGKSYENKFEISNNKGTIFARNVKSFDVKSIELSSVFSWKSILLLIVLIFVYLYFRAKYRKNRKNYKKYLIKKRKKRNR